MAIDHPEQHIQNLKNIYFAEQPLICIIQYDLHMPYLRIRGIFHVKVDKFPLIRGFMLK